jgi:hypothetical protein
METINKLYDNQTYFDIYNSSVFATVFFLLVFFVLVSYIYIQRHIDPIKNNWSQERCNPMVIPMAGLINAPPNTSKFDFTAENLNFCVENIIKDTTEYAIKPIQASHNMLLSLFSGLEESVNDTRKIFSSTRNSVGNISQTIMGKILNVVIPLQKMMLNIKTLMSKAHAVLVVGMNSGIASIITILSALFNIHSLVKKFIIAATASIAAMWFIPFVGFEMAAAATVALTAITVPFGLVNTALGKIEKKSGVPMYCFKKGTLIRGFDNTLYTIENIPLGTKLRYGGDVYAVLKLTAGNQPMYQLGNITVSGSHKVYYKRNWIQVANHPHAKQIQNFEDEHIYCLNTTGKKIFIGDYIFMDWDEIPMKNLSKYNCVKLEEIYDKYENGFDCNTVIQTRDKGDILISNLEVGDVLKNGQIITGTIKIANHKPLFNYGDFIGTHGLSEIQNLGIIAENTSYTTPVLYHILTDTGDFNIKEHKIKDYNWNIDFLNIDSS